MFEQMSPAPPPALGMVTRDGVRAGSVLDLLVAHGVELARLAAGCATWAPADRATALARLDRLAGVLTDARARLLVAEKGAATTLQPGDRDVEDARARTTRAGLGEVRREVRQAEAMVALDRVAQAVRDGAVPLAHLDALARASSNASPSAAAVLADPATQRDLVGLARRQSAREFGATVARLVAEADPGALDRSAAGQHRARFFVLSHQSDGTRLSGRLDRMAGEALRVALATVGHAQDADRDKAQADADALVALAERALAGTAGVRARRADASGTDAEQDAADARVSGVANRPTISLLVPAETFVELREHARREHEVCPAPSTCDVLPDGWRPVEPASLEDGTPVAMSDLARALCDCEIGRIVIDADGVPLDLGRSQRLYTGPQRRAVIVRDRQCAWNGCEVPAAWCDVHHIRWWDRDLGPTSVENGVLVCGHHHTVVHQLDLEIRRRGGEVADRSHRRRQPVRYVFRRRDGSLVNAPPETDRAPDVPQSRLEGSDRRVGGSARRVEGSKRRVEQGVLEVA